MKSYNSISFCKYSNYKYDDFKVGDEVQLYNGSQGFWIKITKKSNDNRKLFLGDFTTFGINGSIFKKGDQIVFGIDKVRISKTDLIKAINLLTKK